MSDERAVQIPYGIDSRGRMVYIEQAIRGPFRYECPECSTPLECREGPQLKYFAHYRGIGVKDCPLRTQEDWGEYLKVNPVERREGKKKILLGIICNPYTDELSLMALFRRPSWNDFSNKDSIDKMIGSLTVKGSGIIEIPPNDAFHPREEGEYIGIALDPDVNDYFIEIAADDAPPPISGGWSAEAVKEMDIFSGSWTKAIAVENFLSLDLGEVIFILFDSVPSNLPDNAKIFSIGKRFAVGVELSNPSFEWLSTLFPDRTIRSLESIEHRFKVDVILPSWHNPRDLLAIPYSKTNSPVIGIIPHPNVDPQFEISTIPFRLSKIRTLSPHGKGLPVLYSPELNSEQATWVDIRLNSFHNTLRFYCEHEFHQLPTAELSVSIRLVQNGVLNEYHLWDCPELHIENLSNLDKVIDINFPRGLEVTLRGKLLSNSREAMLVAALNEPELIHEKIMDWFHDGCFEVEIDAGALGKAVLSHVPVNSEENSPTSYRVSDKEIEERLLAFEDGLPPKVSWSVVRKVLDLPPGTNHSQVKSVKKQVRVVLTRLRGEK